MGKGEVMCIEFLLVAQMLFMEASEHHEAGRIYSEEMELSRAVYHMKQYRLCEKEYALVNIKN